MSSRQIKWLREQMNKNKKPQQEVEVDDTPIENDNDDAIDFSLLADEEEDAVAPPPPAPVPKAAPVPPPANKKGKSKGKKAEIDEDAEFEALALEMEKKKSEAKSQAQPQEKGFPINSLNFAKELKTILKTNSYDEYLKIPKAAASNRFIGKKKSWPSPFPQFFKMNQLDEYTFTIDYTDDAQQQVSVFNAFKRMDDAQSIFEMGLQFPFSPLTIPVMCGQQLFNREFDRATETCLRGFYVLQQSLPPNFDPLKSKIVQLQAYDEFLNLIRFLAQFTFRRCCFETSTTLWKFGIYITNGQAKDFMLLAPVSALYAKDLDFINEILNGNNDWRGVPANYIPDWSLCQALLALPDDILPLSKEFARWPYIFKDIAVIGDMEPTPFMESLGTIFRRRVKKYLEGKDEILQTAAMLAQDMDETDSQSLALSYWCDVQVDDIFLGGFDEEMVLPTG
ncbi:hypothetical protein TVAG_199580 [Trichomonas vaginalis G3]|uniref:Uncharacterized protein n=1 Tax=Trichomonas vaginalis (strain ATCC PRA-98 / G3) TaxID=412133 RepID=A2DDZ3_TRIV3|nr:hypothetical protein TVAGG3_1000200 [Trichomonas vaginalis G3]EAY21519.1 hypothetical protein TVAG_199580 [Trichomonas vaginalis G3]KAI5490735.1 hypothetical protein TVAGG3_1000200 [Trichomonas vaginalis G3]|eukprot:XP_001582505.1 hypothetical protein [Trichomonas vaginalis G3]